MTKKKKIWISVIIVFVIAVVVYALFFRPSYYKFNGGEAHLIPILTERYTSDHHKLIVIGNYIYECNTNGLVKKDTNNLAVWSKSYYIETPLLVTEGKFIAVADITGKKVYVFDETGYIRTVDESNDLISIHINEFGFLTTVMESDKRNIINYYNNEGELVITRVTGYFEDGYPISVASSQDVSRMMTAYINVNNNRLQSTISFFGFADQYDKLNERIIGGFTYEDMLVNEVKWLDNETAIAIFDKQIVVFDCKKEPVVKKVIELTSEIRQIGVSNNTFEVLYGKNLTKSELDVSQSVCLYDYSGELIKVVTVDEEIKSISAVEDGFYLITQSKIIKYVGKKREWFSSTYLSIDDFYELEEDLYLVTTEQGFELLKMREK